MTSIAMETNIRNQPHLMDYKLVLEPCKNIIKALEEVLALENIILANTCFEIILGSFQAKEELESTLIRWIQRICNQQGKFLITLNNFGGRPPHNIHLRIQDPAEIKKMVNQLHMIDHFIQSNDCPPALLPHVPQLNIMNSIAENHYQKVLNEFSGKTFHENFMADKVKLYKKSNPGLPFRLAYAFSLPENAKY